MTTAEDLAIRSRSDSLRAARAFRMGEWFAGRKWRIVTEISGTIKLPESEKSITYDHGEFWIEAPASFQTPLGHIGRQGFTVREVDPADGTDLEPITLASFGYTTLVKARDQYDAIQGELPAPRRKAPAT